MKIILVLGLLGSMAVPGEEPPIQVRDKTVSPEAVVLAKDDPATFRLHVETDVAVTGTAVPLQPSTEPYDHPCVEAAALTGVDEALDLLCTIMPDAPPGTWTIPLKLRAPGRAGVAVVFTVEVRRRTAIDDFTLTPEHPSRGQRMLFKGRLRRFDGKAMKPYPHQPVLLSVRVGNSNWDLAVQTRTDDEGRFSVTPQARASGRWQALYPGTDRYAKSTSVVWPVELS